MSEDIVLVEQAKQGSCEAFSELIRRHSRRVYRVALHILRHREDAEDAAQSACLSAYEHIGSFRSECRFSTWLMKIAVNEALSRLRSRNNEQSATDTLDPMIDDAYEPREIPDWRLHPERQYQRMELQAILRNALEELPVAYSVVFLLRDVEGFSTAEVADALSLTISATKVRLLRARLKLRSILEKNFGKAGKQSARARDAARSAVEHAGEALAALRPRTMATAAGD